MPTSDFSSNNPAEATSLDVVRLLDFLSAQRWFASKSRTVLAADVREIIPLTDNAFAVLLNVAYTEGGDEIYFMTLDRDLRDALGHESVSRRLLQIVERGEVVAAGPVGDGTLRGTRSLLFEALHGSAIETEPIRIAGHDQSNSAVVVGDKLFLKLFRKVEPGVNPDYEVARYLTENTSFTRLPRVAGAIDYQPAVGPAVTLATLLEWVPNDRDAWHSMLHDVRAVLVGANASAAERAELLGRRTAELHLALAKATDDIAFAPAPLTIDDCEALAARLRRTAEAVFEALLRSASSLTPVIAAQVVELLERGPAMVDKFASTLAVEPHCTKTRIHGDYHLGQVLCQGNDFIILDFEGEPARSLAERRAKDSPLRDVAGMLRSFGYAAYAGLFAFTEQNPDEFTRLEPVAKAWQQQASAAYLRGYFSQAQGASFLPADEKQLAALLDFFVAEKALYEVLYELNNRPGWLRIPLAGILAIA